MAKRPNRIGALTQAQFIRLLLTGDSTVKEIAEETGMHPETARRYIRALHSEGVTYIHHFEPDDRGRYCAAVHRIKLGDEVDAKKYAHNTTSAYLERLRLRRLATGRTRRLQARVSGIVRTGKEQI